VAIAWLPPSRHIVLADLRRTPTVEAAMKQPSLRPSHRLLTVFAAGFGLALVAMPTAHAFTLDGNANTNSDGTARYTDPDAQFSGSGSGSGSGGQGTTIHNGNATFHFGPANQQQSDDRSSINRMFDPLGRPGDPR
jgi:hypothetical protein